MSSSSTGTVEVTSSSSKNHRATSVENTKEEEICDDWEQLDAQKIEKSLQSIKLNSQLNNLQTQVEEKPFVNLNSNPQTTTSNSTPFFPTSFKILKRPQSNKNLLESSNPNPASTQPIKTLEQREQEYAQARLRILGSAHPEQETSPSNNSMKHSQSNSNFNPSTNQNYANTNSNNSRSNYANNAMNNNYGNNAANRQQQHYQQNQPQDFSITREPVGPDGTTGFRGNTNFNNKPGNYNGGGGGGGFNNYNNKNFVSK